MERCQKNYQWSEISSCVYILRGMISRIRWTCSSWTSVWNLIIMFQVSVIYCKYMQLSVYCIFFTMLLGEKVNTFWNWINTRQNRTHISHTKTTAQRVKPLACSSNKCYVEYHTVRFIRSEYNWWLTVLLRGKAAMFSYETPKLPQPLYFKEWWYKRRSGQW